MAANDDIREASSRKREPQPVLSAVLIDRIEPAVANLRLIVIEISITKSVKRLTQTFAR